MNNVTTTLRISEDLKKELDRLALEQNRSLNNLITTIILKSLDELKKEKSKNNK